MLSCKGITQKIESDEFGEGRVEGASRGPVPSAAVPPLPALHGTTAGHRCCGPKSVGTATHLLPRAFVGRGGRRYYLFDHAKLGLRASPHSPGSCRRTGRILSSVRKNWQPKAWTQCPGMPQITAPSPRLAISRWKNSRSRSRLASKPLTSGFVKSGRSSCVRMSSVSARSPL